MPATRACPQCGTRVYAEAVCVCCKICGHLVSFDEEEMSALDRELGGRVQRQIAAGAAVGVSKAKAAERRERVQQRAEGLGLTVFVVLAMVGMVVGVCAVVVLVSDMVCGQALAGNSSGRVSPTEVAFSHGYYGLLLLHAFCALVTAVSGLLCFCAGPRAGTNTYRDESHYWSQALLFWLTLFLTAGAAMATLATGRTILAEAGML